MYLINTQIYEKNYTYSNNYALGCNIFRGWGRWN